MNFIIPFARAVPSTCRWTRRSWLIHQAALLAVGSARWPYQPSRDRAQTVVPRGGRDQSDEGTSGRVDPDLLHALALQAVDTAKIAGATYADARLTRIVKHTYMMDDDGRFSEDEEFVGVGVRALVSGYWGFAASATWTPAEVGRLARTAVRQAKTHAAGAPRTVELGTIPVATGTWTTPIAIDPFIVPIEEKLAAIIEWKTYAQRAGCQVVMPSGMTFVRQERVLATSDGTLVTQILYESGGQILCRMNATTGSLQGLQVTGRGWELFLDAKIPEQLVAMPECLTQQAELDRLARPCEIGRYTVVCDGATMAALLEQTMGQATQLDRALGYEANAGGTSFLDDPLGMAGHYQVASPLVTVTANRSAPTQLATVRWDDEGVVPEPFPLVKDGLLVDYQTTREQAAWLAPYYQQHKKPVRSHGCSAAQDAHYIPLQMMPNLALEPSSAAVGVEDLVTEVSTGLLVEGGYLNEVDFQARTGLVSVEGGGRMRLIRQGKLGRKVIGGSLQFDTLDLWRSIVALGGATTTDGTNTSPYAGGMEAFCRKGEPAQAVSHSARAVAATIRSQPVINVRSKG